MSIDKQQLILDYQNEIINDDHSNEDKGYDSPQHNEAENNHKSSFQEARKLPQYLAAITATFSALASGMVLAWTSPITPLLENGQYHNISINSVEMGWIGSFVSFGAMTMCFPFGIICDAIGRRSALLLLIVPFSIGWSLIIWAKSLLMLYSGRFITGMAVGACCVGAPLYNTEIAHKDIRGSLGGYFQLMVTVGIFMAYLIGKFTTITQYTFICASAPFIFFILFVFQPETPLYSLKRMQIETARESLKRLRGPNYNIDVEIESMKLTLSSCAPNNSIWNTLHKKSTKRALCIIFALMFFQQMSGVNAIIVYTSDIFIASGSKLDPLSATIIVGAFQVVATFISTLIIEKLGRRILLIASEFMMTVSLICLGIYFTLKNYEIVATETLNMLGLLPIASLCIFIVMFSVGAGPIPWSLSGEIFTPEVKSIAASSAATFNWFLAFLVTKFYLQLEEQVGAHILFYVFSCISFCGTLFCFFIVPETKGKSIEEIQRDLEN